MYFAKEDGFVWSDVFHWNISTWSELKMYLSCDHQRKMSEIVQFIGLKWASHRAQSDQVSITWNCVRKTKRICFTIVRTITEIYGKLNPVFFFQFMWRPFPKWSLCDHKRYSAQRALCLFVLVLFFLCLLRFVIYFLLSFFGLIAFASHTCFFFLRCVYVALYMCEII